MLSVNWTDCELKLIAISANLKKSSKKKSSVALISYKRYASEIAPRAGN